LLMRGVCYETIKLCEEGEKTFFNKGIQAKSSFLLIRSKERIGLLKGGNVRFTFGNGFPFFERLTKAKGSELVSFSRFEGFESEL